jgi:hypothetical protein
MRGWLLLASIPFLLFGCSGKKAIREEPSKALLGESLLFLAAVQGNPLCVVVDIDKRRDSRVLTSPETKWRVDAWLVFPGTSKYLCTKKGKSNRGTSAPLYWTNDNLLFTTDKDEFVLYVPHETGEILLLTDPIFADRVRSGQEEEIRYGRMPGELYWNNRRIEGNLFYENRAWPEPPATRREGPLVGLEPGSRQFVLWAPDGELLYLEKEGEIGQEEEARFAAMQDRRGRWQETYKVEWIEPGCAFSGSPCSGEDQRFRLEIPMWEVEGYLEMVTEVLVPTEANGQEGLPLPESATSQLGFWTALQGIPQAKESSSVAFCLLKGRLRLGKDTRAVYGLGLIAKHL